MDFKQLNEELKRILYEAKSSYKGGCPFEKGVCPYCGGEVFDEKCDDAGEDTIWYDAECQDCGTKFTNVYEYESHEDDYTEHGDWIEILDEYGNPIIKDVEGNSILDSNGNPIKSRWI